MTFLQDMDQHHLAIMDKLDGREVIYTPQGGSPHTIIGLFQNYTEMLGSDNVDIVSSQPVLSIRTIDVPNIQTGDQIEIDGTSYSIAVIRPDSEGITEIMLEAV